MLCITGKKNKANTCLRINLISLWGELLLWLNNMPICTKMKNLCENPSVWVGFPCRGQSPLMRMPSSASEKQISRVWIQSLFHQLHGGDSCPTPKFSSNLGISPSATWCWAGRISRTFCCSQLAEGFLPTSKTSVCALCLKALCKIAGILQTPCKALA